MSNIVQIGDPAEFIRRVEVLRDVVLALSDSAVQQDQMDIVHDLVELLKMLKPVQGGLH